MNCEYGWIKYTTKKEKNGKFTTVLSDFPNVFHTAETDQLSFARCLEILADKIRKKEL